MRLLKLTAFLSLWAFFFGLVATVHLWISILVLPNRWKIISRLNRNFTLLLRLILNIKVIVAGDEGQMERGGYVIIANHVSYVDGIVLGSIFPILFVSKREVKSWPIVGQWNILCGTIFINRQRKEEVGSLVEEMTRKLKQETNILLFPEGTSTNGEKLLALRSVEVLVTIQPKIECFQYEDSSAGRKKLAEDCYNQVLGRIVEKETVDEEDEESSGEPSSKLLSS